jgi:uncharacterized protein with PIN domain
MMSEYPKYIADAGLAKLAKWLRLLGWNTTVFSGKAGRKMMRLADAEKRIILTRRQDMPARQFTGKLYLVTGKDAGSQIKEVITKFSLKIEKQRLFSICLRCNERLLPVAKEGVKNFVPPYVFANCGEYNQCPCCRKIYWHGTHKRNSLQFLERLSITPS